jgi:hypothetical protein
LLLYQDGEATPVSDLMENELDPSAGLRAGWRLPVFEAGRCLVAFDGAALLLLELWCQESE